MKPAANRIGGAEAVVFMGLPVLLSIVLSARHIGAVLDGVLQNPDSYMRLARLRDSLTAGQPLHVMPRDGSGLGTVVHWSHLIDSLLCLLALPFTPFMDQDAALLVASALFGPLSMAALGLGVAWAAAPFCERRWLWLAPLSVCLGPAILPYGLVGVVHHHVACVLVAVMTSGWAARAILGVAPRYAGWPMGAWAGVGLWLTPETLPLSVAGFGAMWLAWLARPRTPALTRCIGDTGLTFLIVTWLAWAVDPPESGWIAEEIDRISVLFVALAGAIAATGLLIKGMGDMTRKFWLRLMVSGLCGAGFATIWLLLFAGTLFGPRPVVDATMFQDIVEMAPVRSFSGWLNYLFTGCLAVVALTILTIRHRAPILAYATLGGVILLVLGQMHVRFASYPEALGAVMLPVVVSLWADRVAAWPAWRQPLPRMATIILFVLVPFVAEMANPAKAARARDRRVETSCSPSHLGAMLAPYAGQVVLSDINIAPELLYRSDVVTVASLYHRNPSAFLRLRSAWRGQEETEVPAAFGTARIGFVLFCPTPGRSALVRDLPETTLLDRLSRGQPPSWLYPVATDPDSGFVLYRVGS